MRAWLLSRTGGPEVLRLTERPAPEPGPGEVAVDVEAIGINYAEVLSRKGLYGWAPPRPYVPGMEVTGRVAAAGPGVDPSLVGSPVIAGMQHGGYAERVVVSRAQALPAMEGFTVEENAAFAVNFMTAWVSLWEMARLRPTDRVVVTAAAGGVGTAAVKILVAAGCDVVGLAGSDEKLDLVRSLGARAAVNYRQPGWPSELRAALPTGADVVLEVVGGEVYRTCIETLAPFGRIVVAGYASLDYSVWKPWSWWRAWRDKPRADIVQLALASAGVMASHIGYLLPDEARLRSVWRDLTEAAQRWNLRPEVGHVLPFEELPEAHRLMESRKSTGKIVVRVR